MKITQPIIINPAGRKPAGCANLISAGFGAWRRCRRRVVARLRNGTGLCRDHAADFPKTKTATCRWVQLPVRLALLAVTALVSLLAVAPCHGSQVRIGPFTNSMTLLPDTNDARVFAIGNTANSDGSYSTIGLPLRLHMSPDGSTTNAFLQGNYMVTNGSLGQFIPFGGFPQDSGPTVYRMFDWQIPGTANLGFGTLNFFVTRIITNGNGSVTFQLVTNALGFYPQSSAVATNSFDPTNSAVNAAAAERAALLLTNIATTALITNTVNTQGGQQTNDTSAKINAQGTLQTNDTRAAINAQGVFQTNDTRSAIATLGTSLTNTDLGMRALITNTVNTQGGLQTNDTIARINTQGAQQTNDTVAKINLQGTQQTNDTILKILGQGLAQTNDTSAKINAQGTLQTNDTRAAVLAQGNANTNDATAKVLASGVLQTNDTIARINSQGLAQTNDTAAKILISATALTNLITLTSNGIVVGSGISAATATNIFQNAPAGGVVSGPTTNQLFSAAGTNAISLQATNLAIAITNGTGSGTTIIAGSVIGATNFLVLSNGAVSGTIQFPHGDIFGEYGSGGGSGGETGMAIGLNNGLPVYETTDYILGASNDIQANISSPLRGDFIIGIGNTISPGFADASFSMDIGWFNRIPSSSYAIALGQSNIVNTANGGFAFGYNASSSQAGTFVWNGYTGLLTPQFASTGTNQFLINALGGVGINTNGTGGSALALNLVGAANITSNLTAKSFIGIGGQVTSINYLNITNPPPSNYVYNVNGFVTNGVVWSNASFSQFSTLTYSTNIVGIQNCGFADPTMNRNYLQLAPGTWTNQTGNGMAIVFQNPVYFLQNAGTNVYSASSLLPNSTWADVAGSTTVPSQSGFGLFFNFNGLYPTNFLINGSQVIGLGTAAFSPTNQFAPGSLSAIAVTTINQSGTLLVNSGTNVIISGITVPANLNGSYWLIYTNPANGVADFRQTSGTNHILFNDPGDNALGTPFLLETISNAPSDWASSLSISLPQNLDADDASGSPVATWLFQTNTAVTTVVNPSFISLNPYQPNSSVTYLATNGNDFLGKVGGYPFKTWEYAEAAAGTRGAIVHLAPNSATQISTIVSNNLVIEGESLDSSIVNAFNGATIQIFAYSNILRNFTTTTAIFTEGFGHTTFDHLNINGAADAIYIQDSDNLIRNCRMTCTAWDSGFCTGGNNLFLDDIFKARFFPGNPYCRCIDVAANGVTNFFTGCHFDVFGGPTNACIFVDGSATVIVEGCTMTHGFATNQSYGVYLVTPTARVFGHWTDNGVPMVGMGTNIYPDLSATNYNQVNLVASALTLGTSNTNKFSARCTYTANYTLNDSAVTGSPFLVFSNFTQNYALTNANTFALAAGATMPWSTPVISPNDVIGFYDKSTGSATVSMGSIFATKL